MLSGEIGMPNDGTQSHSPRNLTVGMRPSGSFTLPFAISLTKSSASAAPRLKPTTSMTVSLRSMLSSSFSSARLHERPSAEAGDPAQQPS